MAGTASRSQCKKSEEMPDVGQLKRMALYRLNNPVFQCAFTCARVIHVRAALVRFLIGIAYKRYFLREKALGFPMIVGEDLEFF